MRKSWLTPPRLPVLLVFVWLHLLPTSRSASSADSAHEYITSDESANEASLESEQSLGSFDLGSLSVPAEADVGDGDVGHEGQEGHEGHGEGHGDNKRGGGSDHEEAEEVNTDFLREELELEEQEKKVGVITKPWNISDSGPVRWMYNRYYFNRANSPGQTAPGQAHILSPLILK